MWARLTELALGAWLLASPFVFAHPSSSTALWIMDFTAGALLVASTALNYRHPSRRYYLAVPLLGAALILAAFLSGPHPLPGARQNHIMVGLTLMMLGIVPNAALRPPESWRVTRREQKRALPNDGSAASRRAAPLEVTQRRQQRRENDRAERR